MFFRNADEDKDAELLKQKRRQSRKCTEGKKDFKALFSSATGLTKGKGSLKGLWNAVKQDQESFYLEIKQALKDDKADAIQLFLDRHNMTPKSLINGIVEVLKGSDVDDVWEDNIKNKVISGMKKKVLQRERKELTEIIPKSFLTYLPKSLVVNVGENGKIKEMKTVYAEQINDMKAKMDRQKKLLNCIDDLKKQLSKDLKSKDEDKKLCAVIISLMLETGIRPGNLESKDLEETYGASTLEEGHIKFLSRNRAELKFRGKKGTLNKAVVTDAELIKVLKEIGGTTLREDGSVIPNDVLSKYLRQASGQILNLTDFRKLKASQVLLDSLKKREDKLYKEIQKLDDLELETTREEIVDKVLDMVKGAFEESEKALNHESKNTTINSYINPQVLLSFLATGEVADKLEDIVLNKKQTLKFDPMVFIEKALGTKK